MAELGVPVETDEEMFARRMRRMITRNACGGDSRAITVTPAQRALLAELLTGVPGAVADSLRLVLDLDELVSAGQDAATSVSLDTAPVGTEQCLRLTRLIRCPSDWNHRTTFPGVHIGRYRNDTPHVRRTKGKATRNHLHPCQLGKRRGLQSRTATVGL